jgi:phosphoglycolate phosphatase-like HAD superfamily hydrolase
MTALAAETGVAIDVDLVLGRLGPKLEWELANWYPAADVPAMAARYRELYWEHCVGDGTSLLPGARESVDAVHARNGKVLVVTAKSEPLAHRCLATVGIAADVVVGHVHGDEKRDALEEHGAQVYVGDVIADIEAGIGAGALAVGVTTGMHDERDLAGAGATVVFPTLAEFPRWLASLT